MESLSRYEEKLIPMTELAKRVDAFAARCRPDTTYTRDATDDVQFRVINIEEIVGDPEAPPQVGVVITADGETTSHILNTWSRSQLLSTVGTKEKWFSTVTKSQEAEELNLRRATMFQHRFRTMDTEYPKLRILRGIVSASYGDIPDVDIMRVLVKTMPQGHALRHYSTKTDRALYIHAVNDSPIGVPGVPIVGYPGVVVKNSEVGYTSLWVIPALYMPGRLEPLVFEKHAVLRRIHRGTLSEMQEKFDEAMMKASVVWSDASRRAAALASRVFPNEDTAVLRLKEVILGAGGTKMLALTSERRYRAQQHTTHDARAILAAILEAVEQTDADDGYTEAAVAGAVLWDLTT